LSQLWSGREEDREGEARSLTRALAVREMIDTSARLNRFLPTLLFAEDGEWEDLVEQYFYRNIPPAAEARVPHGTEARIIDGAIKSSWMAADALSIISGGSWECKPYWPRLTEWWASEPVLGALQGAPRDWIDSFEGSSIQEAVLGRGDVEFQHFGRLATWAAEPARQFGEVEFGELPTSASENEASIPSQLELELTLGLSWSPLLWRLAPLGQRSTTRYGEAIRHSGHFLAENEIAPMQDINSNSESRHHTGN
jgi:hypothetical protein